VLKCCGGGGKGAQDGDHNAKMATRKGALGYAKKKTGGTPIKSFSRLASKGGTFGGKALRVDVIGGTEQLQEEQKTSTGGGSVQQRQKPRQMGRKYTGQYGNPSPFSYRREKVRKNSVEKGKTQEGQKSMRQGTGRKAGEGQKKRCLT